MKRSSPPSSSIVGAKRARNLGLLIEQFGFISDGIMQNNRTSSLNKIQPSLHSPCESKTYISEVLNTLRSASGKLNEYYQKLETNSNESHSFNKNHQYRPEIDFIPPLVNKTVTETVSMKRKSLMTVELTQALLCLILDFVNPFFYDKAGKSLMETKTQMDKNEEEKTSPELNASNNHKNQNQILSEAYKLRAIDWALARISDLLQPSDETEIPELEALLAATGSRPHDLSVETQLQNNILESMESMEKYMNHNNKKSLDLCPGIMNYIDDKRRNLVNKMKILQYENLENDTEKNISEKDIYDLSWSRNPLKWFRDIKRGVVLKKTEYEPVKNNKYYTNRDITEEFPFLYQMQDFLHRHEKEERLEDILR